MGTKQQPASEAITKVAAAMMCPEPDVAQPTRARSASFASVVADLRVGGDPAAKVFRINPDCTIGAAKARMADFSEALRNTVMSSVKQAKKRLGGSAEFSVEIVEVNAKSTVMLIALVTRNA